MDSPDPTDPTGAPAPAPSPAPTPFAAAAPAPAPAMAAAAPPLQTLAEQVALELLRDRRRERRWSLAVRLGWLGLAIALVWSIVVAESHTTAPSGPHTALVEVRGVIDADADANAESLISALRSAFEDEAAKAVVLRINSPGGSPVQSGIVNDEIRRLKALHKKKVYAVVEEMAASGAYYIAVAADEIYVDKASIVGSIGVLMDNFGFTGLMEKIGVERRLMTAGTNKAMLDPFSPVNEVHRAHVQAMLDQIHRQFIDVVKQGRGERLKETPETFSGMYWNGEEAIRLGLADKLGNLDYVARDVIGAEEVIDYTPRDNVAERLAKRFGASIGEGAVRALQAAAPVLR